MKLNDRPKNLRPGCQSPNAINSDYEIKVPHFHVSAKLNCHVRGVGASIPALGLPQKWITSISKGKIEELPCDP